MKNSKSTKNSPIDKKAVNFFLKALIITGIFVHSVNLQQVLAQATKADEDNNPSTTIQGKFNFSAGIGLPEILYIGPRYQLGQFQVGLYIGSAPWLDNDEKAIRTMSTDVRYHFGGTSQLSNRRPWYMKLGLIYHRIQSASKNTSYSEEHSYWLATRIGREFNLTKQFGTFIEIGTVFCLHDKYTSKKFTDIGCDFVILPGFGVGLFYGF